MTLPGYRDVGEEIAGPPPETKRTDVPAHWQDNPEGWWAHVGECRSCAEHFEAPA